MPPDVRSRLTIVVVPRMRVMVAVGLALTLPVAALLIRTMDAVALPNLTMKPRARPAWRMRSMILGRTSPRDRKNTPTLAATSETTGTASAASRTDTKVRNAVSLMRPVASAIDRASAVPARATISLINETRSLICLAYVPVLPTWSDIELTWSDMDRDGAKMRTTASPTDPITSAEVR